MRRTSTTIQNEKRNGSFKSYISLLNAYVHVQFGVCVCVRVCLVCVFALDSSRTANHSRRMEMQQQNSMAQKVRPFLFAVELHALDGCNQFYSFYIHQHNSIHRPIHSLIQLL